jgi:hypothetical protein
MYLLLTNYVCGVILNVLGIEHKYMKDLKPRTCEVTNSYATALIYQNNPQTIPEFK